MGEELYPDLIDFDIDLLVRMSPLTKGPIKERRGEIKKNLVLSTLTKFPTDKIFTVEELRLALNSELKCSFTNDLIISILDELIKEEFVQHISGLNYRLLKKIELPSFGKITEEPWKEFLKFVKANYKDYDPYLDRELRKAFDEILMQIILKFVLSNVITVTNIDIIHIDNFNELLKEILKKHNLNIKYVNLFSTYLNSNSTILLNFIFNMYNSIINVDLIFKEQEMPSVDFINNMVFLLADTTILTALMCKSHFMHPMALAVTNQCKENHIPIYFCEPTKGEFDSLIKGSEHEMSSLLETSDFGVIRSPFVFDYRKQELGWHDYLLILKRWEKLLSKNYNIIILPKEIIIESDKDTYAYFKRTIPILDTLKIQEKTNANPYYRHKSKNKFQIDHDSFCVSVISYLRKLEAYKDGMGPWFLTFDGIVSGTDAAYAKENSCGLVIQLRTLLNYFVIYSKIKFKKEEEKQVAEAIIRNTIGIDKTEIRIDEYSELVTYKIGLNSDFFDIIKELFIKSPLKVELESALRYNRGEEADNTAYKILSDASYIETIILARKSDERAEQLLAILKKKEEELKKEKIIRQTLESMKGPNVIVNISANINVQIQTQLQSFINILNAHDLFNKGIIEKPDDLSTKDKIFNWLKRVKEILETTDLISNVTRDALLPLTKYILTLL